MRVLVIGGTHFLGKYAVRSLVTHGHQVTSINIDPEASSHLPEGSRASSATAKTTTHCGQHCLDGSSMPWWTSSTPGPCRRTLRPCSMRSDHRCSGTCTVALARFTTRTASTPSQSCTRGNGAKKPAPICRRSCRMRTSSSSGRSAGLRTDEGSKLAPSRRVNPRGATDRGLQTKRGWLRALVLLPCSSGFERLEQGYEQLLQVSRQIEQARSH